MPRIARYEILEEIARGGMGVVYRARHLDQGEEVALKVLLTQGQDQAQRLIQEGNALCHLSHPHIVGVREVGYFEGRPFLALEFVAGESLQSRLDRGGPLLVDEVLFLGRTLADALSVAHGQRILHRDVKPSNVLLRHTGAPVLGDFGLAKDLETPQGLTKSSTLQGSPGYWSPEQAGGQGKSAGPASDVFSLGATLYACLSGAPPHSAGSLLEAAVATMNQAPAPLSRQDVPRGLEELILACLEKAPEERPSAGDLASDFASLEETLDNPEAPPPPRALWLVPLVGAGLLVLGSVLSWGGTSVPVPSGGGDESEGAGVGAQASRPVAATERPDRTHVPSSARASGSRVLEPPRAPAQEARALWREARAAYAASPASGLALGERAAELGVLEAKVMVPGWIMAAKTQIESERQARAHGWLREAAALGEVRAHALLATCYLTAALGQAQDAARALPHLERAKGITSALASLGVILLRGHGVPKDPPRARAILREAAAQGSVLAAATLGEHLVFQPDEQLREGEARELLSGILDAPKHGPTAHFWLGTSYESGRAGNKDRSRALDHYLKASLDGHGQALVRAGRILRSLGGEKRLVMARKAFERAIALRVAGASRELGRMVLAGEAGLKGGAMRAGELFADDAGLGDRASLLELGALLRDGALGERQPRKALALFMQAGAAGDPEGYFRAGNVFHFARGVEQDYAKAARYYELAIKGEHDWAMTNLGSLRRLGLIDGRKDTDAAIELYERAAKLGNGRSMARLAAMHEKGEGVQADPRRALELWRSAAAAKDPVGLLGLGERLEAGKLVKRDLVAARKHYELAAESKSNHRSVQAAKVALARCLTKGIGLARNPERARKLLGEAAGAGYGPAKKALAKLGR